MSDGRLLLAVLDTFHDFFRARPSKQYYVSTNERLVDYVLTTIQSELDAEKDYINQHPDIHNLISSIKSNNKLNTTFEDSVLEYCKEQVPNIISMKLKYEETLSSEIFTNKCLEIFKVSKAIFVEDTLGSVKREFFCDLKATLQYKGLFDNLDAWPRQKADKFKHKNCLQLEFQNYALTKEDRVLIEYDSITADNMNKQISFIQKDRLNASLTTVEASGVSEFRSAIYKLEKGIRFDSIKIALNTIEHKYGLPSAWAADNRYRYVRSLYDLKRSGDYMAVEAALQANKTRASNVIYIFVSVDRMAVGYALTRGVPSVLVPAPKAKEKVITIYNPPNQPIPISTASTTTQVPTPDLASATAPTPTVPTATKVPTPRVASATPVPARVSASTTTVPTTTPPGSASSRRSLVSAQKREAIYNELRRPHVHLKTVLNNHSIPFTPEILVYLLNKNPNREIEAQLKNNYRRSLARVQGGKTVLYRQARALTSPQDEIKTAPVPTTPDYQAIALQALDKTFLTKTLMRDVDLADPLYEILQIIDKKGEHELTVFEYLVFRFLTFPPKDSPGVLRPNDSEARSTPRRSYALASR